MWNGHGITLKFAPRDRWGRDRNRSHNRRAVLSSVGLGIHSLVERGVEEEHWLLIEMMSLRLEQVRYRSLLG